MSEDANTPGAVTPTDTMSSDSFSAAMGVALAPADAPEDQTGEAVARPHKRVDKRWRAARGVDKRVVEALYLDYAPRLRRYLIGMFGLGAPVDDLLHDTFVVAIKTFDGFRGDATESTWLHGIAHNLGRNWRSTLSRREQLLGANPQHGALPQEGGPTNPESSQVQRQAFQRLHERLRDLPEELHQAFVLHKFNDHSFTEIAALQGVAVSTASARVKKAETTLRLAVRGGEKP